MSLTLQLMATSPNLDVVIDGERETRRRHKIQYNKLVGVIVHNYDRILPVIS